MDKLDNLLLGLGIGVAVGLRLHEICMAIEQKRAVDMTMTLLKRQTDRVLTYES
jgi:hypothetical protein